MDQELKLKNGIFTVSLDFELLWGVSEHRTVESYGENLRHVPKVIEDLLSLFDENEIHGTWATVGMLFCESKKELLEKIHTLDKPNYKNQKLSNFNLIPLIEDTAENNNYFFALPTIRKIQQFKGQEIATHTFSHFYCLEQGPTLANYLDDLSLACRMAKNLEIDIQSIVFPRNQYSQTHIDYLSRVGIRFYRGNETHWIYSPRSREEETLLRKVIRFADSYINISGDNTHLPQRTGSLINIPSSRFLRPHDWRFAIFDKLRLHRICSEMTYAAKNNRIYHLWWHPHNFGHRTEANFNFLRTILKHFLQLKKKYNFQSLNMQEIGELVGEQE